MFDCPSPGLYFQYDEEEYHAIPALGSTNIKDLLSNPVLFYARSWMSKAPEEDEEENINLGKVYGSAYHTRILEGYDKFMDLYAPTFDASDYPDAYDTTEDIKARLRELKQEGHNILLTGNKQFLIDQLLTAEPDAEILNEIKQDFMDDHVGVTLLPQKIIDKIEYSAAFIENHPQLSKCFTGGYPEVTIIWPHPDFPEIMLKARIDYLKLKAFVDLKTFANKFNKPTERALYAEMANYKYHIQATHYWDGVYAAVQFAKSGDVYGDYDEAWLKQFAQQDHFDMYYVFQQTGIAPIARGKKFNRGGVYQCGVAAIHQAIETYREYLGHYGTDQWVDMTPITDFHDDEFPVYTVEL